MSKLELVLEGIGATRKPRLLTGLALAAATLVLDCYTPAGVAIWLLQVAVVWATSQRALRRETLTVAVACSVFVFLGLWLSPRGGSPIWIVAVNRILGVAAIWLLAKTLFQHRSAAAAHREAATQLEEASARVRVLIGLLPICASCKKIRDEGGRWQPMEFYVREHSEAEFTHGLCDECIARLYPNRAKP
jgi:type IV secretory pathway TrbD component